MMLWQDWIFTIGQTIFVFAMIPTIRGKDKPALSTSVITAIILLFFAFTQYTLNLYFSALTALATSSAWTTLALQKYRQDKK